MKFTYFVQLLESTAPQQDELALNTLLETLQSASEDQRADEVHTDGLLDALGDFLAPGNLANETARLAMACLPSISVLSAVRAVFASPVFAKVVDALLLAQTTLETKRLGYSLLFYVACDVMRKQLFEFPRVEDALESGLASCDVDMIDDCANILRVIAWFHVFDVSQHQPLMNALIQEFCTHGNSDTFYYGSGALQKLLDTAAKAEELLLAHSALVESVKARLAHGDHGLQASAVAAAVLSLINREFSSSILGSVSPLSCWNAVTCSSLIDWVSGSGKMVLPGCPFR